MGWDKSNRSHSVLIFAIKLRQLLTGESYALLKIFGDSIRCHSWLTVPEGVQRSPKPCPSLIQERKNDEKILGLTRKIIQLLTGEVPTRYEDITVFFTIEEWEYVEGHKNLYKDVLMEGGSRSDHDIKLLHNTSPEKISDSKTMDRDRSWVTEKMLHFTKEIIYLLTKETKPSDKDHVSGLIIESSPPSLIHERNNDEKILDVTTKIIALLTEKTSIRFEDIEVCFSMEEWEHVERHKDLYKDILMDSDIVESCGQSPLDITGEKAPKCPQRDKDCSMISCVLTYNPPHQLAESTKSCCNQPNTEKHTQNHKDQTSIPCCKCEKPLKSETSDSSWSKNSCRNGLLEKRGETSKKMQFSCLECGRCFTKKNHLDVHLRIHTLSKIFPCSECGKDFTNHNSLETHMRVHTGEKPYKCSECDKYFANTGNLQAHYRFHTGEKPFPCSECNKTFRYKSHLVAHQRFHTGQTLPCTECGKHFVYRSHLMKHLQIHTGEKPFKCPECGKCFHRSSQLAEHEMIHTGESPFKCEECDKCFRFPSDLFRHQKTHTGEKPFYCPECGKGFTRRTSLSEHKKIHTGEKPYCCPKCGKLFLSFNYMIRHLKTHNKS